jgi:hypothetical protein
LTVSEHHLSYLSFRGVVFRHERCEHIVEFLEDELREMVRRGDYAPPAALNASVVNDPFPTVELA